MNPILRYRLWKLSRAHQPSADFVHRLNAKLGLHHQPSWFTTPAFRASFASLVMVASMGVGTVSYAYASDEVTPDHPLYPVREAAEAVEEAVAPTPSIKQAVIQKHLERRVQEIEVMKKRLPTVHENEESVKTLDRVETAIKQGIEQKQDFHEVGKNVKKAMDETDTSKLRPFQKRRLENVRSRLERALKLRKDD